LGSTSDMGVEVQTGRITELDKTSCALAR
jgi:hypothetical protein